MVRVLEIGSVVPSPSGVPVAIAVTEGTVLVLLGVSVAADRAVRVHVAAFSRHHFGGVHRSP